MQNHFLLRNEWCIMAPNADRCEIHACLTSPPGTDLLKLHRDARLAKDIRWGRDFVNTWISFDSGSRGENGAIGYTSMVKEVYSLEKEWHFLVRRLDAEQVIKFFRRLLDMKLLSEEDLKIWQQLLVTTGRLNEVPATREHMSAFFARMCAGALLSKDAIQDFLYNLFMNKPYLMERLGVDELNHIGITFADPRQKS